MKKHLNRLLLILIATTTVVVALVVATVMGADGTVLSALTTAVGILVPALIDAASVEKRRRTPGKHAVEDDVSPEESDVR